MGVNARALLLPYTLSLIAAMAIVQIIIAVLGGDITGLSGVLVGVVAVGIVVWLWRTRHRLTHVRFGQVIAHTIAFVTVTTSFNVHAVIRILVLGRGEDGFARVSQMFLTTPWFGATLVMTAAWGLGLLVHLIGIVLGRGWED